MTVKGPKPRGKRGDDATLEHGNFVALFTELLRPYGIPPTPLHEALRVALERAGWQPPAATVQQRQLAAVHGRTIQRREDVALRRILVSHAYKQLPPHLTKRPGSTGTAQAIIQQLKKLPFTRKPPMSIRTIKADIEFMKKNGNFGV